MDTEKKACFIVPFFGKLPNTFQVFLCSCKNNPDYNWIIISDDMTAFDYPPNVRYIYSTFGDFVHRVQACFDFPIALKKPYKICDFRAAFGIIFQEELKGFRFWGHCDLDQYFGKINRFITDDVLSRYDKILCLGHFTLFRNIERINNLYLKEDRISGQSFLQAFSEEKHWIFDEWPAANTSINRIVKQEKIETYYDHGSFCDLVPFQSNFQRYIFNHETEKWTKEKIRNMIFIWDNGTLIRCYHDKTQGIVFDEVLYAHIRQRKLQVKAFDPSWNVFCIYPNEIVSYEERKQIPVKRLLQKSALRSLLFPDELARKKVLLSSYYSAAKRRIKAIGKR